MFIDEQSYYYLTRLILLSKTGLLFHLDSKVGSSVFGISDSDSEKFLGLGSKIFEMILK